MEADVARDNRAPAPQSQKGMPSMAQNMTKKPNEMASRGLKNTATSRPSTTTPMNPTASPTTASSFASP